MTCLPGLPISVQTYGSSSATVNLRFRCARADAVHRIRRMMRLLFHGLLAVHPHHEETETFHSIDDSLSLRKSRHTQRPFALRVANDYHPRSGLDMTLLCRRAFMICS
jgi:hypothetical protein